MNELTREKIRSVVNQSHFILGVLN